MTERLSMPLGEMEVNSIDEYGDYSEDDRRLSDGKENK
jgi:hypothetical protein